ncbi:lipoprotein [Nocardia pseudobrasiliensis]|uniref:lipoprotein n=1 Tax=Nocardia pseudobrasiliensis TaxID=45979 RepID=UPI000834B48C|nr:lipoprotein [Nocardia pseudobrasiliensis]
MLIVALGRVRRRLRPMIVVIAGIALLLSGCGQTGQESTALARSCAQPDHQPRLRLIAENSL